MKGKETSLDRPLGGLFLMTILTIIWITLAEYYFNTSNFKVTGISFGIIVFLIIIFFIYSYRVFSKGKRNLPETKKEEDPTKEKLYWIIMAVTGIAIFVDYNVLFNLGQSNLFISTFALIVGLHFIPLSKVFKRKFDYYVGIWTISISIIGLILIIQQYFYYNIVNAFVCVCCAISTISYGIKMINDGKEILLSENNIPKY